MWNDPWWRSLLHLLFVAIAYGKVSLWLWKREFLSATLWPPWKESKPRVGFGAHVCYHCRISPPRFLAECRKRRLNQGSFVLLCFKLSALFDLYLVFACLFSCTVFVLSFCMFIFLYCFSVSISQVIGCEDRLRNDVLCVGWGVKLYSLTERSPK